MTGFVYKWTNSINGKWYIGSHRGSSDDGYTASGVLIKQAFYKHGMRNFTREILYTGKDYRKTEEKFLIESGAATNQMSYNMINTSSDITPPVHYGDDNPAKRPEIRKKISERKKGKTLGKDNAQYGTKWITNGDDILKVQKEKVDKYLQNGWKLGRQPLSKEIKNKISVKLKGKSPWCKGLTNVKTMTKGTHGWFTNGYKEKFIKIHEAPAEWWCGRHNSKLGAPKHD